MTISLNRGGGVISGTLLSKSATDSHLSFGGGTTRFNGGCIDAYGKDESNYPGWVVIRPADDNNYTQLILKPNGTATWGNKNLAMQEDFIPRSGGDVMTGLSLARNVNDSSFGISGGKGLGSGGTIGAYGKNAPNRAGYVQINCDDGVNSSEVLISPSGSFTFNYNNTVKNVAMYEDVIPRGGGAVISGDLYQNVNTREFVIGGGTDVYNGAVIALSGLSHSVRPGTITIQPRSSSSVKHMFLHGDGSWTWDGTAVQLVSDQRLKQQIAEIDDKLLDAWQDVDLVQFKYNDAVNEKGDNARLHTGYVVQQIDNACKSHNVDISTYGLYCHEEYPQETEEVEVEQADGTKTKEKKVIREASEHYSLRYTEVYAVECMYLRREVSRLKHQNEDLEQRLKMLEQSVK